MINWLNNHNVILRNKKANRIDWLKSIWNGHKSFKIDSSVTQKGKIAYNSYIMYGHSYMEMSSTVKKKSLVKTG